MSRRILIPLDGSEESEEIVSLIQRQIELDDEVTLLQVIPPLTTQGMAGRLSLFCRPSRREQTQQGNELPPGSCLATMRGVGVVAL